MFVFTSCFCVPNTTETTKCLATFVLSMSKHMKLYHCYANNSRPEILSIAKVCQYYLVVTKYCTNEYDDKNYIKIIHLFRI